MINPNFEAIFNIFTKQLAVLYGDTISTYTFVEEEEWTKASFNGDENHPNYLHIQVDYDECFQLLFYPREYGSSSLNEKDGTYYNSNDMHIIPSNLKLVYNNHEWDREWENLLTKTSKVVLLPNGL